MISFYNKTKRGLLLTIIIALCMCLAACQPEEEIFTEIDTRYTDALKLESLYEGKSFIDDGIGLVSLRQKVDGDTAHLYDDKKGYYFTCRFLMINTPESTGQIQEWGKKASVFVGNILSNAVEIVCESEQLDSKALLDATGKRYLGYIWYRNSRSEDFRLLNLEIVEQCYSRFLSDPSASKYGESFRKANDKSYQLGKRVFGELDPGYDYSLTVHEITISELRQNFARYDTGTTLKITFRIVRSVGDNLYVEDIEETWNEKKGEYERAGIYMFSGYGSSLGRYSVGSILQLNCKYSYSEVYGNQLTAPATSPAIDYETVVITRIYDGKTTINLASLEGLVINITKMKIVSVSAISQEGAYTIHMLTEANQAINVRIDKTASPKLDYELVKENIGKYASVIGGVSQYEDGFQMMMANYGAKSRDFIVLQG